MELSSPFSDKINLALIRILLELTEREWAVLLEVANDEPNERIADRLCMQIRSVQNCRHKIADKLGLKGYGVLGRVARQHRDELHQWFERINDKQSL